MSLLRKKVQTIHKASEPRESAQRSERIPVHDVSKAVHATGSAEGAHKETSQPEGPHLCGMQQGLYRAGGTEEASMCW